MAKKGDNRLIVKIKSTESSHFYSTYKNKKNTVDKLQLKKYDPFLNKRVLYKEAK